MMEERLNSKLLEKKSDHSHAENENVDTHYQKGFWPKIDGVAEHTQMLTHIMREAKRHQRSIVITLLEP